MHIISSKLHPEDPNADLTRGVIVCPRHLKRVDPFGIDPNAFDMVTYVRDGQAVDPVLAPDMFPPAADGPAKRLLLVNSPAEIAGYVSIGFPLHGFMCVAYGQNTPVFDYVNPDTNMTRGLFYFDLTQGHLIDEVNNLDFWHRYDPDNDDNMIYVVLYVMNPTLSVARGNAALLVSEMEKYSGSDFYPGYLTIYDALRQVEIQYDSKVVGSDLPAPDNSDLYFMTPPAEKMIVPLKSDTFSVRGPADITDETYRVWYTFPRRSWINRFVARKLSVPDYNVNGQSQVMIRLNKVFPNPQDIATDDNVMPFQRLMDTILALDTSTISRLPLYNEEDTTYGWPAGTFNLAPPTWIR
jgi:hypothetical protein